MKTLRFETTIGAPREEVWKAMLAPETYRDWTSAFAEGSYYEGTWAAGERIRFLVPDGSGMVSIVAECRPPESVSLRHVGVVKDGVEDTTSDAVKSWAGAYENYTLSASGASTSLAVDLAVTDEFEDFMVRTWPAALARLKEICEGR